jgi:hypothetical protein
LQVGFEVARFRFAGPPERRAKRGIGFLSFAVGEPSRRRVADEALDPAADFTGRARPREFAASSHRRPLRPAWRLGRG